MAKGPIWKRNPYGTRGSDAVYYSFNNISPNDIIETTEWNQIKNAINTERQRRGLSSRASGVSVGETVLAQLYNSYNSLSDFGLDVPNVTINDLIERTDLVKLMERLQDAGENCICNCNYCTCNCNQCTCNCYYACTCQCAY